MNPFFQLDAAPSPIFEMHSLLPTPNETASELVRRLETEAAILTKLQALINSSLDKLKVEEDVLRSGRSLSLPSETSSIRPDMNVYGFNLAGAACHLPHAYTHMAHTHAHAHTHAPLSAPLTALHHTPVPVPPSVHALSAHAFALHPPHQQPPQQSQQQTQHMAPPPTTTTTTTTASTSSAAVVAAPSAARLQPRPPAPPSATTAATAPGTASATSSPPTTSLDPLRSLFAAGSLPSRMTSATSERRSLSPSVLPTLTQVAKKARVVERTHTNSNTDATARGTEDEDDEDDVDEDDDDGNNDGAGDRLKQLLMQEGVAPSSLAQHDFDM